MPAVTVEDTLSLPKISSVIPPETLRPIRSINTAARGFEGEGFPVARAFTGVSVEDLDPFIHMDQMGSIEYGPGEPKGTPWHPHRGFETVTYMIDGIFQHQDSIGGGGIIMDGATQWMTAGSGILHIERPPDSLIASGGLFHGIQLWVNLPSSLKMTAPRYQDLAPEGVKLISSPDGGALVRIIAGSIDGHEGPGMTHTPIALAHLSIAPGAQVVLPWNPSYNALAYVLSGDGWVGAGQHGITGGQLATMGAGEGIILGAHGSQGSLSPALEVLLLGGQPIREPVAAYGPFVMNTRDELRQAFEDFEAGRLGTIPKDHI
jgi:redox-sensitive bicupin YhaK (pirin superfamily)